MRTSYQNFLLLPTLAVYSNCPCKAESLTLWNSACSLARDLGLGKELPRNSPISGQQPFDVMGDIDVGAEADNLLSIPNMATKEGREERRRVWLLLYTAGRHPPLLSNT